MAALRQQENVLNGRADRNGAAHFEHARHSVAAAHAPIGMRSDRRYVVGQEHSLLCSGPGQKDFIFNSCQTGILRANQVDTRISAE